MTFLEPAMSHTREDQNAVSAFVIRHGLEAPIEARLLDLLSELGEVAKELLNATNYGRRPFSASPAWGDELGDCFFSLICLANSTGVDLHEVLLRSFDKYKNRIALTGAADSGKAPGG
jgi:NTP pyrophosphatase (non-canonical NTP hydrolase)